MNLEPLFNPKSIAVIGVSLSNDRHPANVIFSKNQHRYPVDVFAVNPKGGFLQDETVYSRIADVPAPVDLAVLSVRADMVGDTMADCIKAGVRSAVVISGGFSEMGRGDLQEKLVAIAKEADFPFIGPNCLGIFVPSRFDTLFLPSERMILPQTGSVALVSQSGGILVDQMIKFSGEGIGMSKAISIGNKAVIRELDLLEYFAADSTTKVIAFYVEGFRKNEGRQFVTAAVECSKPIVMLKAGKSPAGQQAVASHTASLAGDYDNFRSALMQHSVLEVANDQELASYCEVLSAYNNPIEGRVAIITGSGGHGAIAVDACSAQGLTVPSLDEIRQKEIIAALSPSVQAIASCRNPIDLTGSAADDDFVAAMRLCCKSGVFDCILVLLLPYIPGITSDLSARLSAIAGRERIPLIAYVPHEEKYAMLIDGFQLNGNPVSPSIEGSVLMAKALSRRKR
ncbi:MAG: CoA-binding protein [Deltaproteobacteria bacterium]|nr:CoA-binding protein [Deltaproteobacteria bacterium]